MTYLASLLLLYASVTLLAFAVILMWFSVRRLHRQLVQQTADLQRVETMLREFQRTSARPKMVLPPSIVRSEGLRYGSGDAMKFEW